MRLACWKVFTVTLLLLIDSILLLSCLKSLAYKLSGYSQAEREKLKALLLFMVLPQIALSLQVVLIAAIVGQS